MNTDKINKAKDEVAKKHGFRYWHDLQNVERANLNDFINEAMHLYLQTELEEAGRELPDINISIPIWENLASEGLQKELKAKREGAEWMRSEASKVIAKKDEEIARIINIGIDFTNTQDFEIQELKSQLSKLKAEGGETVYRKVSIKEHGLPTDGKPHYYILKDGALADKPKYSIHKEQIEIIKRECEYWLQEVTLPIQSNNDSEIKFSDHLK